MTIEIAPQRPHSAVAGPEMAAIAPPRIRLTWILADPDHCRWRNEYTLDGETWNLVEEYAMVAGREMP